MKALNRHSFMARPWGPGLPIQEFSPPHWEISINAVLMHGLIGLKIHLLRVQIILTVVVWCGARYCSGAAQWLVISIFITTPYILLVNQYFNSKDSLAAGAWSIEAWSVNNISYFSTSMPQTAMYFLIFLPLSNFSLQHWISLWQGEKKGLLPKVTFMFYYGSQPAWFSS